MLVVVSDLLFSTLAVLDANVLVANGVVGVGFSIELDLEATGMLKFGKLLGSICKTAFGSSTGVIVWVSNASASIP